MRNIGYAMPFLLLAGCHQQADATDYLIILGVVFFVLVIWRIDRWIVEAGYRIEPAPYVNMAEPTKIEQKAESQKASEPK